MIRIFSSEGLDTLDYQEVSERNRDIAMSVSEVKSDLVNLALKIDEETNEEELQTLSEKLIKFNNLTKWYWMRKSKINFNSSTSSPNNGSKSAGKGEKKNREERKAQKDSNLTESHGMEEQPILNIPVVKEEEDSSLNYKFSIYLQNAKRT